MLSLVRRIFAPPPHRPRLADADILHHYPRYRWRIIEASFIGYATFYFVRNNFSPVSKDIADSLHYTHEMIGNIMAGTAISYGIGKFFIGAFSDRSNARLVMALGLFCTAMCNFAFGSVANYHAHLALWTLNGFFQGMGWPPCARGMSHWFAKHERGLTFSIWNTSHNVGGGITGVVVAWAASYGGWRYAFYFPGCLALIGVVYILWRFRDTPQSVGLPPIEEYRALRLSSSGAFPIVDSGFEEPREPEVLTQSAIRNPQSEIDAERDLTFRELFFHSVLPNPWIWLLAFANLFAYIARYSMLDWGSLYLREVKHASLLGGGVAIMVNEFPGIPSTILLGWFSDYLKGRRGIVAVLCLIPIMLAFITLVLTPPGHLWLDMTMFAMIGFFIYPVINLIIIMALDITSKKAIGTAGGFIGMFGYIGRTAQDKGFGWMLHHLQATHGTPAAWKAVIWSIVGCTLLSMLLLVFTLRLRPDESTRR